MWELIFCNQNNKLNMLMAKVSVLDSPGLNLAFCTPIENAKFDVKRASW